MDDGGDVVLHQILSVIAEGEARTRQDLAEALDAPEPLVSQMVDHLAKEEYLTEAAQCAAGCEGCPVAQACGNGRSLRIWTLTDKGARAIKGT
mgnify:CR=1 FL=1